MIWGNCNWEGLSGPRAPAAARLGEIAWQSASFRIICSDMYIVPVPPWPSGAVCNWSHSTHERCSPEGNVAIQLFACMLAYLTVVPFHLWCVSKMHSVYTIKVACVCACAHDPCRCILFVPAVHSYPLPPLATESCRLLPPPSAYRQFKTIKAQKTVKAPSVLAVCADKTLDLDGKLRFSPHTSPCTDLFLHACCTLTCARSSTYTISHSLLPELTCTTWRWMLFDPLIDLAVASLYSDLAIAIAG